MSVIKENLQTELEKPKKPKKKVRFKIPIEIYASKPIIFRPIQESPKATINEDSPSKHNGKVII